VIKENVICKICAAVNDYVEVNKKWFHDLSAYHMQFKCGHCGRKSNIPKAQLKADTLLSFNNMGAIQSNSAIYLSISDGKICRRVQSPSATSVQRTTKDGKLVNEEFYKGWSGVIKEVKTRETDYGKEWNVTIDDGKVTAILNFKYSSGYASSFLKALPNVNLSKEVTFSPSVSEFNGKKKTTLFLNQEGRPVKWYYTKETPNGCPSMKQIKVKGVDVWDDSDMMEFLERKTFELFNEETPF